MINKGLLIASLLAGTVLVSAKGKKKKGGGKAGVGKIVGVLEGQVLTTGAKRAVLLDNTGKELWSVAGQSCYDIWKLPNGNILLADGEVREIRPSTNEVIFKYTPVNGAKNGAYSCQRLKNGNTLVGENATWRILELDSSCQVIFELKEIKS